MQRMEGPPMTPSTPMTPESPSSPSPQAAGEQKDLMTDNVDLLDRLNADAAFMDMEAAKVDYECNATGMARNLRDAVKAIATITQDRDALREALMECRLALAYIEKDERLHSELKPIVSAALTATGGEK